MIKGRLRNEVQDTKEIFLLGMEKYIETLQKIDEEEIVDRKLRKKNKFGICQNLDAENKNEKLCVYFKRKKEKINLKREKKWRRSE